LQRLPRLAIADNSSRDRSGDLFHDDFNAVPVYADCVALVVPGGVRRARDRELARTVINRLDRPADGRPVYVDVQDRKENADSLASPAGEALVFDLVDREYPPIGRGDDLAGRGRDSPLGIAEEIEGEQRSGRPCDKDGGMDYRACDGYRGACGGYLESFSGDRKPDITPLTFP